MGTLDKLPFIKLHNPSNQVYIIHTICVKSVNTELHQKADGEDSQLKGITKF